MTIFETRYEYLLANIDKSQKNMDVEFTFDGFQLYQQFHLHIQIKLTLMPHFHLDSFFGG